MAESGYYYSINDFPGNGTQTTFEVSFAGGYISRSHISARLFNNSTKLFVDMPFTWVNDFTIQVATAPAIGYTLRVYRSTPIAEPLVNYEDGALLNEVNLDTANKQAIFAAAEAFDASGSVVGNDLLRDAMAALAHARDRANHTGTQDIPTVTGLASALSDLASSVTFADTVQELLASPAVILPKIVRTADGHVYKVASAGASDHQVVTAGGVKLYVLPGLAGIAAEAFGISTANSAAVNTPLFHKLWDFAAGKRCTLGFGRYKYAGAYAGNVNMRGGGMPSVTVARTGLENGTILEGTTSFSGSVVLLSDMGVDHGSTYFATGADALKISADPYNSGRLVVLTNVAAIGRNDNDAFHSFLVEGYGRVSLTNCAGATNQYCFAIKSRNVVFNGLHTLGGQNGIIFKSDGSSVGSGSLANVAGSNILIEGNLNTVYGLRILAANQSISNVTINGVDMSSVGNGVVVEVAAGVAISELQISDVNGRDIRNFGINTGGAGGMYEAQFNHFNMVELGAYAAQFQVGNIKLNNFYGSLKAGSTTNAATMIRAEASLSAFTANSIELVENYGSGAAKPALYLALNPLLTRLTGELRCGVEGNLPEPGLNAQTPSGSTAALTLLPDLVGMRSTCIVSITAATTVTSITQRMPNTTTNYPRGYLVTIMNTSGFALTLQNNGNIRTRNDTDLVIPINKTATFMWLGSSWHQVN